MTFYITFASCSKFIIDNKKINKQKVQIIFRKYTICPVKFMNFLPIYNKEEHERLNNDDVIAFIDSLSHE